MANGVKIDREHRRISPVSSRRFGKSLMISTLKALFEGRRELFKGLAIAQVKSECGNMRFLMVTGVSKFAKTSIFSAFNNPKDLTLDADL